MSEPAPNESLVGIEPRADDLGLSTRASPDVMRAALGGVILRAGTLIHVNGMPFRLFTDTRVDGAEANLI
jgi:hypothetical protein